MIGRETLRMYRLVPFLVALIVAPGALRGASADPLGFVDYEWLTSHHPDGVTDDDGSAVLNLPHHVSLKRLTDGRIFSADRGEYCPLGLATALLIEALAAGHVCEGLFSEPVLSDLEGSLDHALSLYARGMEPLPVPVWQVRMRAMRLLADRQERVTCDFTLRHDRLAFLQSVPEVIAPETLGPLRLAVWKPSCL